MDGCRGEPGVPVGTIETRNLAAAPTAKLAMESLRAGVWKLKSEAPPAFGSGIVRLQVRLLQISLDSSFTHRFFLSLPSNF